MLVAEDVDTSGVCLEVVSGAKREAAPTGDEHTRKVPVGKDDDVGIFDVLAVRARFLGL